MNKAILTEMFTKLKLASVDAKVLRENLYNLLEHKNKPDTPSDTLFEVASLCIEYEKPLKNVPISGLMLYKNNVELSYLVHTQSKNVDIDLVKSGLDLDSIDINKVSFIILCHLLSYNIPENPWKSKDNIPATTNAIGVPFIAAGTSAKSSFSRALAMRINAKAKPIPEPTAKTMFSIKL